MLGVVVAVANVARDHPGGPAVRPDRSQAGDLRGCVLGAIGVAICRAGPVVPVAIVGALLVGARSGTFLAVDWALMTDIIPKASSGRYMGLSNVATASSTIVAVVIGGLLIDAVNKSRRRWALGPRWRRRSGSSTSLGFAALRPVAAPRPSSADGPRLRPAVVAAVVRPCVEPPVYPRDERPQVDQVVEPDRARPEAEQRLQLDDRLGQHDQAAARSHGQPDEAPAARPAARGSARARSGPTSSRSPAPTAPR